MKRRIFPEAPERTEMINSVELNVYENNGMESGYLNLYEAAERGDVKSINAQISSLHHKDVSINQLDCSGLSPLHRAAKLGHSDVILALSKHSKFDVNCLSKDGSTALHLAVRHRRVKSVGVLLEKGADLSILDVGGKTALHLAARKGHTETVQMILRQPTVDVCIEGRDHSTPLHSAVSSGSYEICQMLLEAGANVYKHDVAKQTPLILAALEKYPQVLQLIISAANQFPARFSSYIHHKDHEGATALHLAVVNNQCESVKILLNSGAEVNHPKGDFKCPDTESIQRSDDQSTALHFAAIFGFQDIALLLIENGANLHSRTDTGQTPLHKSALFDLKTEVAQLLISNGADINAGDKEEVTPLHFAVEKAHLNMVKFLLNKGASPDLVDSNGRTILHFAVESQKVECLELLVQLIPKDMFAKILQIKDVEEMTPLHYCAKDGRVDLLIKLLALGASPADKDEMDRTPIHLAAENGNPLCIEALFAHSKSEINDDDANGRTPMLLACLHGNYSCVKTLLRFGGDMKARGRDECRHSPLTLAASEGHVELVDLLLDNGTSTEAITKFKDTPLHLACRSNHLKVAKLLLNRGVNVSARNVRNETPLDIAIDSRSVECADAIIKSDSWQEAMSCLDVKGVNPFPRLVAFMPSVAESVLDKCITREGNPECADFAVTYNFTYIDPSPNDRIHTAGKGKAWYINDISEHGCHELLNHELTQQSLYFKWEMFAKKSFTLDFIFYLSVVILISSYITVIPNYTNKYVDQHGCPIIVTDEEASNKTLLELFKENGTADRFPETSPKTRQSVQILRITSLILLSGTAVRFIISMITLRWLFFFKVSTYATAVMGSCIVTAVIQLDMNTMIACTNQWRAAWVGILLSWALLSSYLIRLPVVGVYLTMFSKVCESVIKAMLILLIILLAFTYCFFITLNYEAEFSNPFYSFMSVFDMALGEMSFVDRFIVNNVGSFQIDNLLLMLVFMLVIPIALVNLLIGIAVGDIEYIRSESNITLIKLRIKTVDEYGRFAMKWLQNKWYKDHITLYPNRPSKNCLAIVYIPFIFVSKQLPNPEVLRLFTRISRRAVYQRSKGWEYQSRLQPVVDTVEILSNQLEQTQNRLKEMQSVIDHQNEWLMAIAGKVGAELDKRGKYMSTGQTVTNQS